MPDADDRLTALAEAVADGRLPDWDSASASATDEDERAAIRHLRAIADLARLQASFSLRTSFAARGAGAPAGQPPSPDPPVTWGSLRVGAKIGRGRFGDVYRAWDPSLDREVALKLLRRRAERPRPDDTLVVDEGRLMARIRHPNVATIYGAQRIDGRTGLWMELIEGRTLEAELAERGPFTPVEIVRVGIELCRALDAVHRAGLVHRDVKAQNVLLEPTGRIVLGDFGTGQELDESEGMATTIAGTPAYLAPEIFSGAPATPPSDLYSLGALLFHLATRRYPVSGRSLAEIRSAHERGIRESVRALRPELPDALLTAIDTALDPDPARRFASASAMERGLALALPPDRVAGPRPRPWLLAGALGVVAVTIAGAGIWFGGSRGYGDGRGGSMPVAGGRDGSRTFRQISRDATLAGPGAPSPDGRLLSFVDQAGDLAIHEIPTGTRWAVTGNGASKEPTGYAETSRFTAGGTELLYVWYPSVPEERSAGSVRPTEIRAVPIRGGEPRILLNDPGNAELVLKHWAGDDRVILVNRWKAEQRSELAVIDLDTASVRATRPIGNTSPYGASLSPDATLIVYDRPDPATRLRDIFVAGVGEAGETPLIRDASSDHTPMWTRDGRFVLFLSDRSGPTSLWAQRVEAKRPLGQPIRVEPNLGWAFPMGETTGGSYFFRRQIGTRDVYIADLDAAGAIAGEPVRASTEVVGANGASDWSPDGRRLTFFRRRDDRWSLVIKSTDDSREREIAHPNIVGIGRPRWEADGGSILFKAAFHERPGLQRVDLDTGAISTAIPFFFGHYDLVPNRHELIYESNRRTLVRYDLTSGAQTTIHTIESSWYMYGLAISPDGARLAYTARRGGDPVVLRVIDLASPAGFREVYRCPPEEYMDAQVWTRDGREVLVKRARRTSATDGDGSRVWAIDVETGAARLVGLNIDGLNQIRLSPDGRRLSFDGGWPLQEVWVLEHFLSALDGR